VVWGEAGIRHPAIVTVSSAVRKTGLWEETTLPGGATRKRLIGSRHAASLHGQHVPETLSQKCIGRSIMKRCARRLRGRAAAAGQPVEGFFHPGIIQGSCLMPGVQPSCSMMRHR